jgi:hypothetical protein
MPAMCHCSQSTTCAGPEPAAGPASTADLRSSLPAASRSPTYQADPDVRLRRASAEPGISARACHDGEARSRPAHHDAEVGAVCSGAAGAGAIAAQHLRRRPAVQLHQVPSAPPRSSQVWLTWCRNRCGQASTPHRRPRQRSSGRSRSPSSFAEQWQARAGDPESRRCAGQRRGSTRNTGSRRPGGSMRLGRRPHLPSRRPARADGPVPRDPRRRRRVHRQIPRERMRYARGIRISPGRTATPRSLP